MKRCVHCVLPETFPRITFDNQGVCNYCQNMPAAETINQKREQVALEMAHTIQKHRGSHGYDCIVAFSGGKDSSYTLHLLVKKYGLNCLAITIDNGFISEQAFKNCESLAKHLDFDHIIFRPSTNFMNHMYRTSITQKEMFHKAAIKRASRLCNSCINLINNHMIKSAQQHKIKLIAGGYISGQIPKDAAIMQLDMNLLRFKSADAQKYIHAFGDKAKQYLTIDADPVEAREPLFILNPMLTVSVSETEIVETISQYGWIKTQDTGKNSSNCKLNDFGIAVHYQQEGFNPYVFEIAEQVRHGLMDRATALDKVEAIPSLKQVAWAAKKLDLNLEEI